MPYDTSSYALTIEYWNMHMVKSNIEDKIFSFLIYSNVDNKSFPFKRAGSTKEQ